MEKKDTESAQTYYAIYRTLINYIHVYYYLHIHRKYTHIHDLHL